MRRRAGVWLAIFLACGRPAIVALIALSYGAVAAGTGYTPMPWYEFE